MDSEQKWRVALGLVLRQMRQDAEISQEGFAHHAHVTRLTVHSIERGAASIGFDRLVRFCEVLKVRPSTVLLQTEELVGSPARLKKAVDQLETERKRGRPRVVKK